jgi:hypothetical protein
VLLDHEGVSHQPIQIDGLVRESFAVFERSSGRQFRFSAPGPSLPEDGLQGSRYFDSSLGITVVVDAGARHERPRSLLVYVNRSRIDAIGGFWGVLKRTVVRARTRSSMRDSLAEARTLVERRFERLEADTPPNPSALTTH